MTAHSGHKIPQLIPCKDETCAYRTDGHWNYAETSKIDLVNHPACICRVRDVHNSDTERSGHPAPAAWISPVRVPVRPKCSTLTTEGWSKKGLKQMRTICAEIRHTNVNDVTDNRHVYGEATKLHSKTISPPERIFIARCTYHKKHIWYSDQPSMQIPISTIQTSFLYLTFFDLFISRLLPKDLRMWTTHIVVALHH